MKRRALFKSAGTVLIPQRVATAAITEYTLFDKLVAGCWYVKRLEVLPVMHEGGGLQAFIRELDALPGGDVLKVLQTKHWERTELCERMHAEADRLLAANETPAFPIWEYL